MLPRIQINFKNTTREDNKGSAKTMIERKRGKIIQSERNTKKTNTTFYTLRREVFMKKNQLGNNFSNNEIGVSETRKSLEVKVHVAQIHSTLT